MKDRWFGKAFQIFEATDGNDLEVAMLVLQGGTHFEKDEEARSACAGTNLGRVRFETDVPARRELQKSSREPTFAAAMVSEALIVR